MTETKTIYETIQNIFSGGFSGITNIIGSYTGYYYRFSISWQNIFNETDRKTQNGVLSLDPEIHDFLFENPETINAKLNSVFRQKFKQFINYSIYNSDLERIDYEPNVLRLNVYDFAGLFSFRRNIDVAQALEPDDEYLQEPIIPRDSDYLTLNKIIRAIRTENYQEYETNISQLHPSLLHSLLKYIPIENRNFILPLFDSNEPILFDYRAFMYPYIEFDETLLYDPEYSNEINYLRENAKYEINAFIIEIMLDSIEQNDTEIVQFISPFINDLNLSKYFNKVAN